MTKTVTKKSKTVVVAYFGSPDNTEPLTDTNYKDLLDRLSVYQPMDIKALPTALIGSKVLKLTADTIVIIEGDKWEFKSTNKKDISEDAFVKRAKTQLDIVLRADKLGFVLAPYYCKLAKV